LSAAWTARTASATTRTSMLQDLEAGKQLELAPIVTAVVELADLTGAAAPSLRAVHAATALLAQTVAR
jgi:2-dehydropantoate 2-reductase